MNKKRSIFTLDEALNSLFHEKNIQDKVAHYNIQTIWQQAVGAKIAEHACPDRIQNNVLFVNVSSSVWMQELHFLRENILEKINKNIPSGKIKDIRFCSGALRRPEHTKHSPPLPQLDNSEKKKVENEGLQIKDQAVRSSFEGLMAAYLKNRKVVED